jgi:hypothetical protein
VAGAHTRGGPRPEPRDRDARSIAVRLGALALVAGVVAAAVAYDGPGGRPAASAPAAASATATGPAARPASAQSSTWYCAAGTASIGGQGDHRVLLANPTPAARHVTLTIVPGDVSHPDGAAGPPLPEEVTRDIDLAPGSRQEVRLADEVAAPLAAAVVEVDGGGVAVEHRVVGPRGSDVGPCSPAAADTWHLAWGTTTRDARDLVFLFNPFPSPAAVDASFVSEEGTRSPVRWQGFPVPAHSVVAVDLDDDVTRSPQVSATFHARTGRIVVERLGIFDGSLGVKGVSLDLGVPQAATVWAFAGGGATAPTPVAPEPGTAAARKGGRSSRSGLATSEKIVVYNPGTRRAEVDVRLVPGGDASGPAAEPFRLSVGPGAYDVVDYGGQSRVDPDTRPGTLVTSTNGVPVVAERVTTDVVTPERAKRSSRSRSRSQPALTGETTATPGARLAATDWTVAAVGADGATVRYGLVVLNPDHSRDMKVRVLPLAAGGAESLVEATVPAGRVAGFRLPPGAAGGVVVRAEGPVVVERVIWTDDGRRQVVAPGIPSLDGARPLAELVAGG